MKFGATAMFMGSAAALRILAGLATNKIFAVTVGPAGLAVLGQLYSLTALAGGLANAGTANGVTRYVAESPEGPATGPLLATASLVCLAASVTGALVLVGFATDLSRWLLGRDDLAWAVAVAALAGALAGAGSLVMACVNGLKRIRALAAITTLSALASFALSVLLTVHYGLEGAVIAACMAPALPLAFALPYLLRKTTLFTLARRARPDSASLSRLGAYAAMSLTAALASPLAALSVRALVIDGASWQEAGFWQGIWRLSDTWATVAATVLGTYLMPRLAELPEPSQRRRELLATLATVLPVAATGALAIYLLRESLVRALFSEAFLPMTSLFAWQLPGDVARVCGWIFAYHLVARAEVATYVFSEIAFAAVFLALTALLVPGLGAEGAAQAYAMTNFAYLAALSTWVLSTLDAPLGSR